MNYKISRNLEYALMALAYMMRRKQQVLSAREMARTFRCPFDPFSRVLQKLAEQGLISSKKGIGGGYALSKDIGSLSLYELMSIASPPLEIADCLLGRCDLAKYCGIQEPIRRLNKKSADFYKSINVKEILTGKTFTDHKPVKFFKNKNTENKLAFKT